ncbi:MAG: GNAT family N-acetyltransferase [Alphaproteobacteria bacterium]|nr:MAG: GNAT family N-acetyltransferase [Alphaproteobacteria bacterium]
MSRPGGRPMPACCPTPCSPACRTCASRPGGRAPSPIPANRAASSSPTTFQGGLDGTEQRVGEVFTLYVESDFQDRGLGRRLLDAMFRQLHADGFDTAILWMLAANPTRFFYEGLGGAVVGRRVDRMSSTEVEEVAFAWRDLEAPLIRRKLAPEQEEG